MKTAKAAGLAWTSDSVGAALFAWGAASALEARLQGTTGIAAGAALMLLGGLLRLASQYGAQIIGFDEARALARLRRAALFPPLLSLAGPGAPALGATATLGIDHVAAEQARAARFDPVRQSAALAPLLVVLIVALQSRVAALILFLTLIPFVLGMILAGGAAWQAADRQMAAITALAMLAATASVEAVAAIARSSAREAAVIEGTERLRVLLALPVPQGKDTPAAAAPLPIGLGPASLAPGSRIALTGPSGSGKTRVIEALAGLRRPAHALSLGSKQLAALSETAIRAQIALAPQEPMLIAGTVADNLRLARPGIDARAMEQALRTAKLWDRIARMPQGLDSVLGEDGGMLSGGERKRLALARTLLTGRPWLLLDEPTEGIDAATEAALVAALGSWLDATGTGLLIASRRPAPLALATQQVPVEAIPAA